MKRDLNIEVAKLKNINEINLFKITADILNKTTPTLFVEEVHGKLGFVEFNSKYGGKNKVVEISDLMIIIVSPLHREVKLTFLQAKYQRHIPKKKFISIKGSLFQWELLSQRPVLTAMLSKYSLPLNILNFTNYQSISSYGIYYHDKAGEIDMLYTIPEYIAPVSAICNATFNHKIGNSCPDYNCIIEKRGIETTCTCSIDNFYDELLNFKIGAPITTSEIGYNYIRSLIKSLLEKYPGNTILLDVISNSFINTNISSYQNLEEIQIDNFPNIMLICLKNE